jgi:LPS export ABC transporter protein LptC
MKKILFLAVAFVLFGLLGFLSNQEKDMKAKLTLGDDSYMDKVHITHKKDGATKWILDARKAVFITSKDVKLADLKITFPEKELVLTSNNGLYDIDSRNLTIEENINASTKDYDIIATKLFWDSSKNEIMSDERVQIVGRKFHVEGDNLNATNDKATLNKNVKAVFYGK